MRPTLSFVLTAALAVMAAASLRPLHAAAEHHYLYVSEPGVRNYVEYGGVGVLVYDIDAGYKFLRRIPSQVVPAGQEPENVKGIARERRDRPALRDHDPAADGVRSHQRQEALGPRDARGGRSPRRLP